MLKKYEAHTYRNADIIIELQVWILLTAMEHFFSNMLGG